MCGLSEVSSLSILIGCIRKVVHSNLRLSIFSAICLIFAACNNVHASRVVGYYPDWGTGRLPIAQIRYEELSSIVYFSISPQANGALDLSGINITTMQTLVSSAHAEGVTVSICVGGWGRCEHFSAMAASSTARAAFVANLAQFCVDYGLDGVDLDWEPVSSGTDRTNYTTLIQDLKTALSPNDMELTVAAAAWGSEFNTAAIGSIDWLHIMAYDMGTPHSSYGDAISTLTHWKNFGFDKDKLMLGVPFYGKDTSGAYTYKDIIDTYTPAPDVDLVNGINFNGIDTIKAKTEYACNNEYGGIMIWEISQDSSDGTSLLTAIGEAIDGSIANRGYSMIPPDTLTATASSGNAIGAYADPMIVVNGAGLTSPTAHTYNGGTWFTDGSETDRWIVVDLAGSNQLDHIRVWNANEGWGWNAYGFKDTQVYVSNEAAPGNPVDNAGNWTLAASVTLLMAPGTEGYDDSRVIDLVGHTASHVAIRALNTYNSNPTAGLSEVQVFRVRLLSDLDGDGHVNLVDLKMLADNLLDEGDITGEISGDGRVSLFDLSIFAGQWLENTVE